MKPGDIVMIFGNPVKCEIPVGQAKLIKKLCEHNATLESWEVEYLDNIGYTYDALIKNTDHEKRG